MSTEKIEATKLEVVNKAFEKAMAEINILTQDLMQDFKSKGDITPKVAKEMAKERYILGLCYMAFSKGSQKKIVDEIVEEKEQEKRQLSLLEQEETDGDKEDGKTNSK